MSPGFSPNYIGPTYDVDGGKVDDSDYEDHVSQVSEHSDNESVDGTPSGHDAHNLCDQISETKIRGRGHSRGRGGGRSGEPSGSARVGQQHYDENSGPRFPSDAPCKKWLHLAETPTRGRRRT